MCSVSAHGQTLLRLYQRVQASRDMADSLWP